MIYSLFMFSPGIPDYNKKLSCIYELVQSLPPANHDTMKLLFGHLRRLDHFRQNIYHPVTLAANGRMPVGHLLIISIISLPKHGGKTLWWHCETRVIASFPPSDRVIQCGDDNRMTVQNVAIVFGPTLLRPEMESQNIAMHMVFQNQIVEFILNEYDRLFYSS